MTTVVTTTGFNLEMLEGLSIDELESLKIAIDTTILAKKQASPDKRFAHKIRTEEKEGMIHTTSYYNGEFVVAARGLRGAFRQGQWVFDSSVSEHVISAMVRVFGVTGLEPYEVCTLVVKEFSGEALRDGVELFGRPIAKAFGRDSGAKSGDDIYLLSGKFDSGGSVKNWYTEVYKATFEIHNFPVAALTREDVQQGISEGWVEVK